MRLRLLLLGGVMGVGVGVEVMTEKMVVATPSELDVTSEVVIVVGVAFGVVDFEVELVVLMLVVLVMEAAPEEVEVLETDVGCAVLEMKPIELTESPRSSTTASLLSQQLFLTSRLPSQHQEPSEQCWMASFPAAVLSALG
jgi:hypothetical protein